MVKTQRSFGCRLSITIKPQLPATSSCWTTNPMTLLLSSVLQGATKKQRRKFQYGPRGRRMPGLRLENLFAPKVVLRYHLALYNISQPRRAGRCALKMPKKGTLSEFSHNLSAAFFVSLCFPNHPCRNLTLY